MLHLQIWAGETSLFWHVHSDWVNLMFKKPTQKLKIMFFQWAPLSRKEVSFFHGAFWCFLVCRLLIPLFSVYKLQWRPCLLLSLSWKRTFWDFGGHWQGSPQGAHQRGAKRIADTPPVGEWWGGKSPLAGPADLCWEPSSANLFIAGLTSLLKRGDYMVFPIVVWRLESVKGLAQYLALPEGWINCYHSLLANFPRIHLTCCTWGSSNFCVEKWGAPIQIHPLSTCLHHADWVIVLAYWLTGTFCLERQVVLRSLNSGREKKTT